LPESDQALVAQSQRGDRQSFEELVRRTARLIYSRAFLETGDAHRAEDLTQETLLIAWRKISQLTDPAGLRPWLMTILHNVIVDAARHDFRRKRRGKFGDPDAMLRLADDSPTPAQTTQSNDERDRALAVLRNLPEEYRQVLTLRYIAGADYDEISRQLALTNGSLRGLLSRGLELLRKRMK